MSDSATHAFLLTLGRINVLVLGLLIADYASAVVQFQVAPLDIPTLQGATLEFITVEGETETVETNSAGGIFLPGAEDLDQVRGGALLVRPNNDSPAFTATVPIDWDGETPLVLNFNTQRFVVRPGAHPITLHVDYRPLFYVAYQASRIEELARSLGLPMYAIDANRRTLYQWYMHLFLRALGQRLAVSHHQIDVLQTLQTYQLFYVIFALTGAIPPDNAVGTDECRVVNAEAVRETPAGVDQLTAEDFVVHGTVASATINPGPGTQVLLSQNLSPHDGQAPSWGTGDAGDPVFAEATADGNYQLRVDPAFAEMPELLQLQAAAGCYQSPPINLVSAPESLPE